VVSSARQHTSLGRIGGALLRAQPDERLVAMARDGRDAPFDEIVRRHRSSLLAYATSLAPPSRAEDVVQESLLKAYAALRDGADPELLRAWLFRIVRNTAIDEQRGLRRHEQLDENYDGVEQPPQEVDRREQLASLVAAIRDLPPTQRDAIVKRELEGRGHDEIGRVLALSPGAVRQLIYRARYTLRQAAGALVPAVLIRAATLPGADEAAGGLGMAGAVKLGLATVVATGTIVAGTSIDRHEPAGTAEALQLSTPSGESRSSGDAQEPSHRGSADGSAGGDGHRGPSANSGPGSSRGDGRGGRGDSALSGEGGGGNSGPGDATESSGSGSSGSGDGSGSSGSGGGDALDSGGSGGTGGGSGSGELSSPIGTSSGPG
jgi:RNA polymerase sigma factor (sigma-70 family)